jgi:hypothetical protein
VSMVLTCREGCRRLDGWYIGLLVIFNIFHIAVILISMPHVGFHVSYSDIKTDLEKGIYIIAQMVTLRARFPGDIYAWLRALSICAYAF